MKKINLLILFVIACFSSANAQIVGKGNSGFGQRKNNSEQIQQGKEIIVKTKHYNYELSIGPRIGLGIATMSEGDDLKIADGSGMSFNGGIAANIRFGNKDSRGRYLDGQGLVGVGMELNYENFSVKTKLGDDLKMNYFEVPVLLQLYPCYNTKQLKNLYIEVGPTIAGTMSASPDQLSKVNELHETVGNTTHDMREEWIYPTKEIKGFDVKMTVGVGYRFNGNSANDGLYANLRYNMGTSDLAKDFPAKISRAELTVGYLFQCIGTKKGANNTSNIKSNNTAKRVLHNVY